MKRLGTVIVVLALVTAATAGTGPRISQRRTVTPATVDNNAFIGANNLQMVVANTGNFAYDQSQTFGKTEGLYFPRGTDRTVIFSSGLWVGAKVNGTPRVTVAEYSSEFSPGIMENGTYVPDVGRFHVYKVNRGDDASMNSDYANWPVDDGAPTVKDAFGHDSLDADGNPIPKILGDEALWSVYNDADPTDHNNGAGSTLPLGLEVQQYTFAYGRSGALGNSIYLKFKMINKGSNLLDDTYVSIWCDPDVGDAFDDLVGCDTSLSLGFAYNEGPDDTYGEAAPAVGFDFLQGPIVPAPDDTAYVSGEMVPGYRNLPMTSFNKYTSGTDPSNSTESYNYMKGLMPDGTPVINPQTGEETFFQVAGDPVLEEGWTDVNSGDRRFMMSSGPFTMAPGDTQEVVVALLVGQGSDFLSSITSLRTIDEQVQAVFDLNFTIPFPPPQPTVWVQPLPGRIELVWSNEGEGDVQESDILGQRFVMEGYNVYQGRSMTGPWTKIATFDVDNEIAGIYADRFDPALGAIQRIVTQSGTNSGLETHLSIAVDRLTGRSLINHKSYFFAVTSYSYDELNIEEYNVGGNVIGHLTEDLETRIDGIEVVPHSFASDLVDTAQHSAGGSEGLITVRTFEPDQVGSYDYRVTFNEDLSWNLDNLTTGERLAEQQHNSAGDFNYAIVDGIMVQVYSPTPGVKNVATTANASWISGANWGGYYFGGSMDLGMYFFGSSIVNETDLIDVELRFSPTETQQAYTYWRSAEPNYRYAGFGTVPFTAWDVSSDPARQLNVCFVEDVNLSAELLWLPPDDDPTGAREYVFILNSDYDDQPDDYYTSRNIGVDAGDFDVLYAWWPAVAEGHSNAELADGQVLSISTYKYNKPEDVFDFNTFAPGDAGALEGASLDNVHPLPNPYIHGINTATGEPIDGIRFVNLPATTATLEIYNLLGERIATVMKDDPLSDAVLWDVRTSHGYPPASGLYLYRIIVPGMGEKIGKLAVFVEEEQLDEF